MAGGHSINIPGVLLDELKGRDYSNDDRFNNQRIHQNKKKRKNGPQLSRKEKRKQERLAKKHKAQKPDEATLPRKNEKSKNAITSNKKAVRFEIENKKANKNPTELLFSSDDELSSGDFDEFEDDDLNEEEWEQLKELEGEESDAEVASDKGSGSEYDSEDFEDFEEEDNDSDAEDVESEMTAEETMNKLKALKEKKLRKSANREELQEEELDLESDLESGSENFSEESNLESEGETMTVEETMAALKAMKDKKNKNSKEDKTSSKKHRTKKSGKEDDEEVVYPLTPSERAMMGKDEMEMQYYAKKLNLKGSSKKIRARDEFDAIGGLLEGLDFFENFGEGDEEYGDFAISNKTDKSLESETSESDVSESDESGSDESSSGNDNGRGGLVTKEGEKLPFSSDDELSSGDFDEFDENDLDEEEWKQLKELEDEGHDSFDSELEESSSKKEKKKKAKENPYIAPVNNSSDAYIPPSLRKKSLNDNADSQVVAQIRKIVKSSLNKLSDSNIIVIVTSLNVLYDSFPRQYVTEVISEEILSIVNQKEKLLDSFILNYSAVAYSLWRLRGIEVGAYFIQQFVSVFLSHFENQMNKIKDSNLESKDNLNTPQLLPKHCNNIITLLSYCYNFGLITCKLLYNIVHMLVATPNEFTTELLLRIVAVSGPQIRGDDPSALKDILSELLSNVKSINNHGPRLKFLLDTMSDLKNNRLKPSVLAPSNSQVKRNLQQNLKISAFSEPIQVSLDDIKNIETKGKWWLVGASWKGNMESAFEEAESQNDGGLKNTSNLKIVDDLLDDIPDWTEVSKQQRMNTDVRRAIFISIMSAQDFMDAFTKLEKLNLKNKQMLEIPKVLTHCLLTDGANNGYNPYYAIVASKICEHHHQLLKTFQFLFWDVVKQLEEDAVGDIQTDAFTNFDDDDHSLRLKKISSQGKFFGSLIADNVLTLNSFKHVPVISGLTVEGVLFVEQVLYQFLLSVAKKCEKKSKTKTGNKKFIYDTDFLRKIISTTIKPENKDVILKGLLWFVKNKLKYNKYISGVKGSKDYERELRRMEWVVPEFVTIATEEQSSLG
ncbi:hypothetical protein Kpol_499p15 [Vanderwaltozyma polyspora DSM 70294]|uniref:MI domain-containing protein n=1 Tax=Vanderwaltozyma polyspora (strain ATCC 22028 / DSM 70294 / BCRC 21397 / CBS 2163 / NBRC 10782 / NRRL Y-8283 / UCD 57-17) TaxID=436907 RepID=A7TP18_VANPO|nr:uncharacterized protein Kpol_499p15 [Vanderwaltozyma polyspora DSM 70294]EDO15987.1 hypothetical protein Kpol_499p15 [Vanderwaltozyma polyspora DSM 70294]